MAKNYFDEIDSNPNLPEMEKETSGFWKKENPVKKLKDLRAGSPNKVYYDGPITSNGLPHYGHALTWVLKDVVPRFWSMNGYQVLRNMGWDCQGIPVEYEVEKELKFEKKEDIEKFGVEKFNELCRQSVLKYQESMFKYEDLVGRWYDTDEIYSTMDAPYIESIWWSLSELYKKDLLYEGYKVVPYSTRAGTPLSTHEVSEGGYSEIEDPFVTVKFKLANEENTYFLAWTTTPWTIPGNLMLAVGKDIKYVKVESEGSLYILAEERLEEVFKDQKYEKKESYKGSDLEGFEYAPPFNYFADKKDEGCFKVIVSPHANVDDGTGIVHLAPYGEEDFLIFMKMGIKLFDYLNETAHFTKLIPEYEGMFYKKANVYIVEDLKKIDRLFDSGKLTHRMPMCWRTGTPLIYKPIKSWYVAVTKIKDKLVKNNQELDWHPEHLKNGNSGVWLNNVHDWALSRNRYWGTPLPVWVNDKTDEKVFIGSFEELKKLSGVELKDPHRPFVDDVTWEDTENGGTFRRIKDVIDVWYDSGAMPFARFHYPFENKEKFDENFPADYIAEGPDQVRLWFYVMHVLGEALFEKCPYKTIVTNGTMLDEHGKKLSKSKKNYKPMDEVLSVYGGDVLRYFLLTSTITSGQDALFSEDLLRNSRRDFFVPFWNCMRYFTTNANLLDFDPSDTVNSTNVLNNWIQVRFQQTVNSVHTNMNSYNLMEASRSLSNFVTDFSTWYVRRSRDVVRDGDKASISTYFDVLKNFTVLMAPFFPFFAESVYKKLKIEEVTNEKSVHYLEIPKQKDLDEDELSILSNMKLVREVVEKGHSERKEKAIAVKMPLLSIKVTSDSESPSSEFLELIKDELNVKAVVWEKGKDLEIKLDTTITPELEEEAKTRELIRSIQEERKNMGIALDATVVVYNDWLPSNSELLERLKQKTLAKEVKLGEFKVDKN